MQAHFLFILKLPIIDLLSILHLQFNILEQLIFLLLKFRLSHGPWLVEILKDQGERYGDEPSSQEEDHQEASPEGTSTDGVCGESQGHVHGGIALVVD